MLDLDIKLNPRSSAAGDPVRVEPVTSDDFAMERQTINYSDERKWLFNGWQRLYPAQWSTTRFTMPGYAFHFDFLDRASGTRIRDDFTEQTPNVLGLNFRPNEPFCIAPQDDLWYLHKELRSGTFHSKLAGGLTSFSIRTATFVAKPSLRACVSVTLSNRSDEPLALTLLPVQNGENVIELPTADGFVCISSDLDEIDEQGFVWTLAPRTTETHHFVIGDYAADDRPPAVGVAATADAVAQCERDGREQIARVASRLPAIRTASANLDDLYKRCLGSLAALRWEGPEFRRQPTWIVGGVFICQTAWDFSFAADAMSLVDPQSLRNVILDVLDIGKMETSYIDVHAVRPLDDPHADITGDYSHLLYLQDPFALQTIISRYRIMTGDHAILDVQAGPHTVYEWLKLWGDKLTADFGQGRHGLLDIGDEQNLYIELRTAGYDHAIPTLNGLAIDYFRWLAELAAERNDPDAGTFDASSTTLRSIMQERLWNEENGWFDCMDEDGTRWPVYSVHLYDMLNTSALTEHQQEAMIAHLREGEFLAPYGMYSISRKDEVHWDRMDADFGGGGYYMGTPGRIASQLYVDGKPALAWDILKRVARMADHFCFMLHSAMGEVAAEIPPGGNVALSCASAMEAVWTGIFGLRPQMTGDLVVDPAPFNEEVGEAELSGYQFRDHRYDVRLGRTSYEVFVDDRLHSTHAYGRPVTIPA
ncbi:MGH1-like glycoside hydrolase domain-containing protein [Microbacterium sulfonylureivorans]|uniref:MGH1-like glycoside hydrolase domain-containing protein n=1 Tax=Microbacterium sulfonylureivorans TaxID=2486854 RepID=UPI000FD718CF|nr:hypothetical protein [Microbacterium sulfonylureivorans]